MFFEIMTAKKIKVSPTGQKRVAKCKRLKLCAACLQRLDDTRVIEHCHERCNRATKRAIERGDFTREERIREGKLIPSDNRGGPISNPVTKEAKQKAS